MAEQIKALREANTVEAAPERTVRKAVWAERPVVARIRERMEASEAPAPVEAKPEPDKEPEPVQAPEEPPDPVVIVMPEPVRAANGHAKAMLRRGQERTEQLRLF